MNWGNKLLVTFIVFGTGMSYLVYRSMNTKFELVEKDYYKTELKYQEVIDGTKRVNALATPVSIEQKNKMLLLQLPDEMKNKNITGDILFYCDYNEKKDRKFMLQTNKDGQQYFSAGSVTPGSYTVKISWMNDGKNYYSEKALTIL